MLQKLNAKNYICDVQNISKQVQMRVRYNKAADYGMRLQLILRCNTLSNSILQYPPPKFETKI